MMTNHKFLFAFLAIGVLVSGCAQDGTMTTGSLNAAPDPVCVTLAAQIKTLQDQGVPEKVAKAAKKKHKLNSSDQSKAAELNKANADLQAKCSNMPLNPGAAAVQANADKKAAAATKRKLAAQKPPVPVHKPATVSLGATDASAQAPDKPKAPQPTLATGTAVIAPIAQEKPEAAQPTIETGTISSAPPASGKPEAVQVSPQPEAPANVLPVP
ncbi:MAG: hypothetical protein GY877_00275 [Hyphomicrobium sp.]|nr:hypothetical protein [Hyphomicrobium sp.]